jgi:hypothetical protein
MARRFTSAAQLTTMVSVLDENGRPVEKAGLQVLQRLLCL